MNNTKLSLEECYKILGIPYNSTKAEVEAAYKRLLIKYHPDNYVSKSELEQRIAAQRLSDIKDAKDIILNNRTSFQSNSYNTNYTTYTKSATQSDQEYYREKMRKMAQEMEEMRKRDEEELERFKATIIKTIVSILTWSLIVSIGGYTLKDVFLDKDKKSPDNKKETDENSSNENSISLIKTHTLKNTDSLEQLAKEANCTEKELLSLNEKIEVGSTIKIPYNIMDEDLDYYTETIDFDNEKLAEIAKEYNTDIETLVKLNSDSIVELAKTYIIMGDKLEVPNFISTEELKNEKEAAKQKVYTK